MIRAIKWYSHRTYATRFPKSGKDWQPQYPSQNFCLLAFEGGKSQLMPQSLCVQSSPFFHTFVADSNKGSVVMELSMVSSGTELNSSQVMIGFNLDYIDT